MEENRFEIKLPFWMNKGEVSKVRSLFLKWWQIGLKIVQFPLNLFDEDTAPEWLINLIAYQRDIERFKGEPLDLFRKRVKYAFINAEEAGSVQGFKNIFERLGIGEVELIERFDEVNWDVIRLKLTDDQIAANNTLLTSIVRKYGRTCRRYEYYTESLETFFVSGGSIQHIYYYDKAEIK